VGATLFAELLGRSADDRLIHQTVYTWIPVNQFQVDFGLQIDQLSISFVLLISGVGSLIHIYSVAYMADDTDRRRFFGYLTCSWPRCCCSSSPITSPALRRLGGRRPGVLPADRILVPQAVSGHRRQEGVRDEPGR